MTKAGTKPQDYTYAIFHQPNGKFPVNVAKKLGFTMDQVKQGLLVPYIGNTYSGASMIGLASVLDVAKPGDRIFMTSYGSGAGSDGFDMTVTNNITRLARQKAASIAQLVADKEYVDYGTYAKITNLLFWE
jgi:hydroxymethylglutaryl-CoA synthase